jgi:hypothetical protein
MTALTLVEVKPGIQFPVHNLQQMLKSPRWVVRFGAVYKLDAVQLGALLRLLFPDVDIVQALAMEMHEHSGNLQDYVVELGYESAIKPAGAPVPADEEIPDDGLLAEMFQQLEVRVAKSITELAYVLARTLDDMPGKEGRMQLKSLLKQDRKLQQKIGVHEAQIVHAHEPGNLVVFDVSGSMGKNTVRRIVSEVAALAVKANATLAIVSDTTTFWEPGTFTIQSVLSEAEFGGTQYETLSALFEKDWGVVVTIADYDSSRSAKEALKDCAGRIGLLLDISLVSMPTFLAECLAQLADEVRPLMVAKHSLTTAY